MVPVQGTVNERAVYAQALSPNPLLLHEPPALELSGISKRFGAIEALNGVSLVARQGEVHCLLGENGAGKSTLCNIMFGVYQPDAGELLLEGSHQVFRRPADSLAMGIAMVHQHFSVVEPMTVVENLMIGQVSGLLETRRFADRIRALSAEYALEIDPTSRIDRLSVGERQRVEVVKALIREPRILVLDEPTAVLPPLEIDALLSICRKVADAGRAVILVTHKLAEISQVADRVTVLRGGRVVESVLMANADIGQLVNAMVGRDMALVGGVIAASVGASVQTDKTSKRLGAAPRRGAARDALTVDAVSYRDRSGALRLDSVTLEIQPGEVVGLAGVEGNGQSELSLILAGLAAPTSGRVRIAGLDVTGWSPEHLTKAGLGVVPEDRHATGCILAMSVAENLFLHDLARFSRFGMVRRRAMSQSAASLMAEYDVRAASPELSMASLSGGNQQKAVLARELTIKGLTVLLAAQPTRGLDIGAVGAVYDRIREAADRGVGVLLISSELDELIAFADRIQVIYRGRIVGGRPAMTSERGMIGQMMAGAA